MNPQSFGVVAVTGSITAAMAVVTGFAAIISLWSVRNDSQQRSRPVMVARLEPVALVHGALELIIENSGSSAARDVSVTFDPPLLPGPTLTPYIARRYANPVSVVAPRQQFRNVVGILKGNGKPGEYDEDIPSRLRVNFAYQDDAGRHLSDAYNLDSAFVADLTTAGPGDTTPMDKRLARAAEAIARGLGRA